MGQAIDIKEYRSEQLSELTDEIGVYALSDLDNVKLYIGQSTDGIRTRVRRHLTSARSDVIANRLLDVWEVAYVSGWPMPGSSKDAIDQVESYLINHYHSDSPLINSVIPAAPQGLPSLPAEQVVQILPDDEIHLRGQPSLRLPRQIAQFESLFDYILEVKNTAIQRRALEAHFDRLRRYYEGFLSQFDKKQ